MTEGEQPARTRRDPAPSMRDMVRVEVKLEQLSQDIRANQQIVSEAIASMGVQISNLDKRLTKIETDTTWSPRQVYYLLGIPAAILGFCFLVAQAVHLF